MTDGILAIARFNTPHCKNCGQVDRQLYTELFEKQETTCGICGYAIPLTNAEWLKQFIELSHEVRSQYRTC